MYRHPQLTPQTMRVLRALFDSPGSSGADVCRTTRLPSGTVYPILIRLEDKGWVQSRWESGNPKDLGRPRRRFYTLSAQGAQEGRRVAEATAQMYADFAW